MESPGQGYVWQKAVKGWKRNKWRKKGWYKDGKLYVPPEERTQGGEEKENLKEESLIRKYILTLSPTGRNSRGELTYNLDDNWYLVLNQQQKIFFDEYTEHYLTTRGYVKKNSAWRERHIALARQAFAQSVSFYLSRNLRAPAQPRRAVRSASHAPVLNRDDSGDGGGVYPPAVKAYPSAVMTSSGGRESKSGSSSVKGEAAAAAAAAAAAFAKQEQENPEEDWVHFGLPYHRAHGEVYDSLVAASQVGHTKVGEQGVLKTPESTPKSRAASLTKQQEQRAALLKKQASRKDKRKPPAPSTIGGKRKKYRKTKKRKSRKHKKTKKRKSRTTKRRKSRRKKSRGKKRTRRR